MLRVEKYGSIHEINPLRWDSILTEEDLFHTHQFISIIEDSKVENARFSYLLFYEEATLVATTVLSAFNVDLTLFINDSPIVKQFSQWFPWLFNTSLLVCGLPASFGQNNLKLLDKKYAAAVCPLLAAEMKTLAKEYRVKFLAIKEFKQQDFLLFSAFRHHRLFAAHSIPYMKMHLTWQCFDDYLQSLRHHYRRQVLLSLEKTGQKQPLILSPQEYDSASSTPAWVLYRADEVNAEVFYQNYLRVMQRSTTKLETFNQAFFQRLFANEQYKILSLMVDGKAVCSALLLPAGDTVTWVLVAREGEKDDYDSYRNLLYAILAYAINGGYRTLNLGQTAYWTKQCLGAEAANEFFWFSSPNRFWHWLLKKLNSILFPEIKLKKLHVFKKDQPNLTVVQAQRRPVKSR